MLEFRIDSEFRDKIPAMPQEDFDGLRADILRDGYVRDPLVVWKEENILLDGHHRWKVITENKETLADKFQVAGDWSSAATSGYGSSAATSGNGSSAATSGEESSAATFCKNGIALACGKNSRAMGVIGSYIILTEWDDDSKNLICAKMMRIDGETLKPNTWYTLKDGEFVEVPDGS